MIDSSTAAEVGKHNANLPQSITRVVEAASWKRQRIAVIIPAAHTIPAKVYLSHWALMFPPNQPVYRHLAQGQEVGEAYDQGIADVLAHPELRNWEYILTIEHDNCPAPDGVAKLIAQMDAHPEFDCIGGLYWTKGEGGVAQIWGDPKDPVLNFRPQPPVINGLVECCGTGMGFNLWRLSSFRKLEEKKVARPWFKTVASRQEGMGTQDMFFWGRIGRPNGWRCAIDCSVLVGHWDNEQRMMW